MIYYLSLTGNVRCFIDKIGSDFPAQDILESFNDVKPKSIFIFSTTGCGDAPDEAISFLDQHHQNISFLVGSGDTSFGDSYCGGVDSMSKQFNIPVLMRFELDGTDDDLVLFKQKVKENVITSD